MIESDFFENIEAYFMKRSFLNQKSLQNQKIKKALSTQGGTWTRTPQRAQDFKSGVSTNSTTWAY